MVGRNTTSCDPEGDVSLVQGNVQRGHEKEGCSRGGRRRHHNAGIDGAWAAASSTFFSDATGPAPVTAVVQAAALGAGEALEVRQPREEVVVLNVGNALYSKIPQHRVTRCIIREQQQRRKSKATRSDDIYLILEMNLQNLIDLTQHNIRGVHCGNLSQIMGQLSPPSLGAPLVEGMWGAQQHAKFGGGCFPWNPFAAAAAYPLLWGQEQRHHFAARTGFRCTEGRMNIELQTRFRDPAF